MKKSRIQIAVCAVAAMSALAGPAFGSDAERGEKLFGLCVQCHGEAGEGNALALAPSIAGLEGWYVEAQLTKFKSGVRGAHPDDLEGLRMHPMALAIRSEEDIKAISAYIASMPPARSAPTLDGDAARGKIRYAPCQSCHGPNAQGVQPLGPSLDKTSDWYLLTSLKKYKAGVRPADARADPQAGAMIGMATIFPDEQAMKDVIAYIQSISGGGQ
jgi:cytochrome c oxidase subunit 2